MKCWKKKIKGLVYLIINLRNNYNFYGSIERDILDLGINSERSREIKKVDLIVLENFLG